MRDRMRLRSRKCGLPWETASGRAAGRRAERIGGALAMALIAAAALPSQGAAQGLPASLAAFLRQPIGLSQDDLGAVSGGTPIVKALETADQREVAVFGIVRIQVPRAFYVRRVTAFPSSLRDPSRLTFALFADPATAADVANVTLPHDDVQDLARCHPGACKVKLRPRPWTSSVRPWISDPDRRIQPSPPTSATA